MTTAARKDSDQRDEDAPVEPNARLTADVAVVLLVLFVVQIGTVVIGVTSHLTLHVMVGLLLVPPLLVKISSVSWRFVRYYRHDEAYRRKGPPALVLRALSPVFLVVTLVLFISGIVLLLAPSALGGPHGTMLRIHAVSFFLWLLLLLAHLAGHARDLRHLALKDWARRTRVAVPGSTLRQSIVLASLAAGLALALSLVGQVGTFQKDTQPHARHSALAECDGACFAARVPLGRSPFLPRLRSRSLVQRVRRYYRTVRLPMPVHPRITASAFPGRPAR